MDKQTCQNHLAKPTNHRFIEREKYAVNSLSTKSCCAWKMAAYPYIHKPSIKSIHLEITRHRSAISEPLHSHPKQACLLQILGLPVRSHLWCSVRTAIIAPTWHSCRSIMLSWSQKKNNRLHVLKLHNFNKSPTSVPLSCPLSPAMSPHPQAKSARRSVIMDRTKPSITIRNLCSMT